MFYIYKCYNRTHTRIMVTIRSKMQVFKPHNNCYKQQNVLKDMKFIDIIQFRVNGFNLGMYTVKIALSC